jgi:hypothetical protein
LKEKILEITEIARACPENLQTICFELLLKDYLSSRAQEREGQSHSPEPLKRTAQPAQEEAGSPTAAEGIGKGQDDLSEGDLHVKARRLLEKNSLTVGQLNNLFYKENGQILPLYEDLKTTRVAECQVRVTLLHALRRAIETGDFECDVETVRTDCDARKCYDVSNWGNNFKNNAELFDFEAFNKSVKRLRLSERGKQELADLIKELQ